MNEHDCEVVFTRLALAFLDFLLYLRKAMLQLTSQPPGKVELRCSGHCIREPGCDAYWLVVQISVGPADLLEAARKLPRCLGCRMHLSMGRHSASVR